jgi:putative exosortase-associated protein (TIGR04073 family)
MSLANPAILRLPLDSAAPRSGSLRIPPHGRQRRYHGLYPWGSIRLGIATVLFVGLTQAAGADSSLPSPHVRGSLWKLGRGIANVATCPLELIRTPRVVTMREGWSTGMTRGVAEGLWRTLLRGVVGVYEVVTFSLEIPADFRPLIKPEFAFDQESWLP